jgi:hypothetical protein
MAACARSLTGAEGFRRSPRARWMARDKPATARFRPGNPGTKDWHRAKGPPARSEIHATAGPATCLRGNSATMASVMRRPAIEAAPCSAARTTLVSGRCCPWTPDCRTHRSARRSRRRIDPTPVARVRAPSILFRVRAGLYPLNRGPAPKGCRILRRMRPAPPFRTALRVPQLRGPSRRSGRPSQRDCSRRNRFAHDRSKSGSIRSRRHG